MGTGRPKMWEILRPYLHMATPGQHAVIYLHILKGLSLREAAENLRISRDAAEKRQQRFMRKIAKKPSLPRI